MCFHGYYRNTVDIDFWIASTPENARKLVVVIKEFGFETPELSERVFLTPGRMIRMGIEPTRIELLTEVSGCRFPECYAKRIQGSIEGIPVDVISLPDLVANKLSSGRFKDLQDAQKLGRV